MNEATDTCSLHLRIISTSFGLHWQSKNMHACVQVCMHASKYANLGLSNDVPQKKNDGQHIWGCPTMFRSEKPMISTLGGGPTMFRWKNQVSAHWGAVQRCFAGKNSMFSTLGGCPTMFRSEKPMSSTFGAVQRCSAEKKTMGSTCLLYTSPSPRDGLLSRMPSSA